MNSRTTNIYQMGIWQVNNGRNRFSNSRNPGSVLECPLKLLWFQNQTREEYWRWRTRFHVWQSGRGVFWPKMFILWVEIKGLRLRNGLWQKDVLRNWLCPESLQCQCIHVNVNVRSCYSLLYYNTKKVGDVGFSLPALNGYLVIVFTPISHTHILNKAANLLEIQCVTPHSHSLTQKCTPCWLQILTVPRPFRRGC